MNTSDVRIEVVGKAGVITLDRPKALNALTHDMVRDITAGLERFRDDNDVALVIVQGAGERALCAGGDIVALANSSTEDAHQFWSDEYALNLMISEYPKPYVAIMHGIVLGGGIGISAHGSHRIVTDSTRVGMPETGIGFVPDVGGTHLLGHAPDHLGMHLGLTGIHANASVAIAANMADYYVPEDALIDLIEDLCQSGDTAVIHTYAQPVQEPAFDGQIDSITAAYCVDTVEELLARLDRDHHPWSDDAAKRIRRNSPLAVAVAFKMIRQAGGQDLKTALEQELVTSTRMHAHPDFKEGVRAQVIDKDRNPTWQHASIADVTAADVDAIVNAGVNQDS